MTPSRLGGESGGQVHVRQRSRRRSASFPSTTLDTDVPQWDLCRLTHTHTPPPDTPARVTTMDKNELERYQVQLSQVELALASDPENTELASLRSELKELIDLTTAALEAQRVQESSRAESSRKVSQNNAWNGVGAGARTWAAGDECLAKYSGDGQWYPARITSIGGAMENRVYSVVFRGYNNTELLTSGEIKTLPPSYQGASLVKNGAASAKRKFGLSKEEEAEREKKKKKNEKKLEVRAAKAKEQTEKQANWQKFAKKSEKKGIHIAGVAGTSIFKTPENPLGKGEGLYFVFRIQRAHSSSFLCFARWLS